MRGGKQGGGSRGEERRRGGAKRGWRDKGGEVENEEVGVG